MHRDLLELILYSEDEESRRDIVNTINSKLSEYTMRESMHWLFRAPLILLSTHMGYESASHDHNSIYYSYCLDFDDIQHGDDEDAMVMITANFHI